jgi:hypothetical protein
MPAVISLLLPALALATAPANPFCGEMYERNTVTLQLFCVNGVISALPQAFFGTPAGACPNFTRGACDDPTFLAYAQQTCLGQPNCTLVSQGPDPCGGVVKGIAAVASCSEGPGGYSPTPIPPPPSPTCALNGLPCAPPQWEPSWNLTQSTVIQPSGDYFFSPSHPWGLISLDWASFGANQPAHHFCANKNPKHKPYHLENPNQAVRCE